MSPEYSFDVVLGGDLRSSISLLVLSFILMIPGAISPSFALPGLALFAYSLLHTFRTVRTERDVTVALFDDHLEVQGKGFSYEDITIRRSRDAFKLLDYLTLHTPIGEIPLIAKAGIQNRVHRYRTVVFESEYERIVAFLENHAEATSDVATKLSVIAHPYG